MRVRIGRAGGIAVVVLVASCRIVPMRPQVPDGWAEVAVQEIEPLLEEQPAEGGKLWVLIGYRSFLGHSAIMLFGPGEGEFLFWDPAGAYGENDLDRRNDVLLEGEAPDVLTYMNHRFDMAAGFESALALMEWELDLEDATRMRAALVSGFEANEKPDEVQFDTKAPSFQCCVAVCKFLREFSDGELDPKKNYSYPHRLLDDFWANSPPDRVIVFEWDRKARVYVPSDADSAGDAAGTP